MINKTFTTSLLAPQLEKPFVEWNDDSSVEITYVSSAAGSLYYLVQPVAAQTRNLWEEQEEPTVDQLKAKGTKLEMKVQSNRFTIDNLDARTAYTLYYLAVDNFDRTSQIYTASIPAKTEQPEKSEITITSVEAHTDLSNFGGVHHWFDLTLSEDPQEELTKENFNISCPKGDTSLGRVQKNSATEYTLYLKERVILKDSNDFRFTVTFSDSSTATTTKYLDYSAPEISSVNFNRTSETTAEVSFSSDTDGILYWKVLDKSEIPQDTSPKKPEVIINGGNRVDIIGQTTNVLELENLTDETQYFCFVSEDEYGNRMEFYDYEKIPTYVAPEPPVQPEPEESNIASITVTDDTYMGSKGPRLSVTYKKEISSFVDNADIVVRGSKQVLSGYRQIQIAEARPDGIEIQLMPVVQAGEYTLEIYLDDVLNKATFTIE